MFFSPKCPHCVKFKPTFNEFQRLYQAEVNVGSVNCLKNKELCVLYGVKSYPTLQYFSAEDSKVYTFSDSRKMDLLEKFALQEGYKKANWKLIPVSDNKIPAMDNVIAEKLGHLE